MVVTTHEGYGISLEVTGNWVQEVIKEVQERVESITGFVETSCKIYCKIRSYAHSFE